MWATAVELAPMVETWGRLLAEHRSDGAGRCRRCTRGGTGQPAAAWPCVLFAVADQARLHHDRTAEVGPR